MTIARSLLATLLLLASLIAASPAAAFKLTPIEAEFTAGRQSTQTFKVENPGTRAVAIEISVHRRDMALDGSDQLTPAPEDFVVFPDQIVLMPGQSQSVRVQWTGSEAPAVETAYRLLAEQIPVDLDGSGGERSGLELLVRYLAALYVRPADPMAQLSATLAIEDGPGGRELVITVENSGTAHALLRADMLALSAGGTPVELTEEQRKAVQGKNVLAASTRALRLPFSPALEGGPLTLDLVAPAP